VELVRVNGAAFEAMLKGSPEIAVRMLRALSRRLRQAAGAVERTPARPSVGARRTPEFSLETDSDLCQLLCADGTTRFVLHREGDTVVGRADPVTETAPDVDLAAIDPQRSVSGRHARFYRIGTANYVMEELGAVNGTYVNDTRLATGVPAAIHPGDVLRIGLVTLTFWDPSA
jgi:exosome complex RNA-binding protein Csl4